MKATIKGLTDYTISINKLNVTIRGNYNNFDKWPNSILKDINIETQDQIKELEELSKNKLISFTIEETIVIDDKTETPIPSKADEEVLIDESDNMKDENIVKETQTNIFDKIDDVEETDETDETDDFEADNHNDTEDDKNIDEESSKTEKNTSKKHKNSKRNKNKNKQKAVKISIDQPSQSIPLVQQTVSNKGFGIIKKASTETIDNPLIDNDDVSIGSSTGAKKTKTFKSICANENTLDVKESLKAAQDIINEDNKDQEDNNDNKEQDPPVVIHTGKGAKKINTSKNLSNSINGIKKQQIKFIDEDSMSQEKKNEITPFIDDAKDGDIDFVEI